MTSEASTSDTSKGSRGRTTRGISTKSREPQYIEGRWSGWPEPSLQDHFFEWFMKFQDTVLSGLSRRYYTSANKVLRGSEAHTFSLPPPTLPYRTANTTGPMFLSLENTNRIPTKIVP